MWPRRRSSSRAGARLGLLLTWLTLAQTARAESVDRCAQDTLCSIRYESSLRWYKEKNYELALSMLTVAYEAVPEPRLLINMGRCLFRLGRIEEARVMYDRALREGPDLPGEIRASVERFRAEEPPEPEPAPLTMVEAPAPSPTAASLLAAGPPVAKSAESKPPLVRAWWLWTAVGVGAGALVTGLAIGLTRPAPPSFERVQWDP